jgi:hypothetical protein
MKTQRLEPGDERRLNAGPASWITFGILWDMWDYWSKAGRDGKHEMRDSKRYGWK